MLLQPYFMFSPDLKNKTFFKEKIFELILTPKKCSIKAPV